MPFLKQRFASPPYPLATPGAVEERLLRLGSYLSDSVISSSALTIRKYQGTDVNEHTWDCETTIFLCQKRFLLYGLRRYNARSAAQHDRLSCEGVLPRLRLDQRSTPPLKPLFDPSAVLQQEHRGSLSALPLTADQANKSIEQLKPESRGHAESKA